MRLKGKRKKRIRKFRLGGKVFTWNRENQGRKENEGGNDEKMLKFLFQWSQMVECGIKELVMQDKQF